MPFRIWSNVHRALAVCFSLLAGGAGVGAAWDWQVRSTNGCPSREEHVAVWTGREMIVWGGYSYDGPGASYEPATDKWRLISTNGAPSARYLEAAIWTGTEMIVWGGDGPGGARYNPRTDSWKPMSSVGSPGARPNQAVVWTGNEMIVWGGGGGGGGWSFLGGRYDPIRDVWTPMTTEQAPAPRARMGAVWTGRELLVWGGEGYGIVGILGDGGRYDPETDTWTPITTNGAPSARVGHSAVWTGSEMIVLEGYDGDYPVTGGRYNPDTDTWVNTSTNNAASGRSSQAAVWNGEEMIIWGGWVAGPISGGRYNPSTDTWSVISTNAEPSSRFGHTMVWIDDGVLLFGGWNFDRGILNDTTIYLQPGPFSGDGLPDWWQARYFGTNATEAAGPFADPDGDGDSNLFEYTAGTVPTNAASHFRFTIDKVPQQPRQAQISFCPRFAGRNYSLVFTTNVSDTDWLRVDSTSTSDQGVLRTVTDLNAAEPVKFYRVQISLPPP